MMDFNLPFAPEYRSIVVCWCHKEKQSNLTKSMLFFFFLSLHFLSIYNSSILAVVRWQTIHFYVGPKRCPIQQPS